RGSDEYFFSSHAFQKKLNGPERKSPRLLADHSQLVQIAEPDLSPATLSSSGSRSPRPQREDKDAGDEKRARHGHASSYWSFLPRSVTRSRNAPISRLRKSTSAW